MSRSRQAAAPRKPARTGDGGQRAHSARTALPDAVPSPAPHCACGGGCPRCGGAARLPFTLEIARRDDPLERDADRVAHELLRAPARTSLAIMPPARVLPTRRPAAAPVPHPPAGAADRTGPEEERADDQELPVFLRPPTWGERVARPDATGLFASDPALAPPASLCALPAAPWLRGGAPLPPELRRLFESRLGLDLRHVRLHHDAGAAATAAAVGARAYAVGSDIVFGAGEFDPHTAVGLRLLAHELAHVLQQGPRDVAPAAPPWLLRSLGARVRPAVQRECVARRAGPDEPAPDPGHVPDDQEVDRAIPWPKACRSNERWWTDLRLTDMHVLRDLDPEHQPRAWANKVLRAQQLMWTHGTQVVEGATLDRDGILGPRAYLALFQVAQDAHYPARADIQGLGFDLDVVAGAQDPAARARALARRPEIMLQTAIEVLGESAVHYYDQFYPLVGADVTNIDALLFGGTPPADVRRADRIEMLRRLYGSGGRKLQGTAAVARVRRDVEYVTLDVARAVEEDPRQRLDQRNYFTFLAITPQAAKRLDDFLHIARALEGAIKRLPPERLDELLDLTELLKTQDAGPQPGAREMAEVLVAIYLPVPDDATRQPVVRGYLEEKSRREQEERARIEEHNRQVAHERADRLVHLLDADDMYGPHRMALLQDELKVNLPDAQFFDVVLDDLRQRPGNYFTRLYDVTEDIAGDRGIGSLVELSLAGRYRDDPRVQRSLALLISHHAGRRHHTYVLEGPGAVLLDDSDRLDAKDVVGDQRSVAGMVTSAYRREEKREQLTPGAQRRFEAVLEAEAKAYFARLLNGQEPQNTRDKAGEAILKTAYAAAHIDPDRDIEDVEWQESVRLLAVRRAAPRPDGVPHYEVQYEVVTRIVGGSGGDTAWVAAPGGAAWRDEREFENALWWYSYSQSAKIMIAFAKIVVWGAVIVIAWEVGVLAALVSAGGGMWPVLLSMGISVAIYMLTHHRWTLEGLLLAGVEGYLAAVGFKIFAPVGTAVARLVIPATLEQVTMQRLIVAWLLKHGAVGALTGGTLGPASLFLHDVLRVAKYGGDFSRFTEYLRAAGWGMLLGAVFEIGGSALLAPLFRAANSTALARLSEVVSTLRAAEPPITAAQWLSEAAGSLSAFRRYLGTIIDDSIANGVYQTMREKMAEAGRAWLTGVRGTLQSEIIELAGVTLSRDATNGLERLLRLGRGTLTDDALATLLQQARQTPGRIDPWLRFLAGVDETAVGGLVARGQLRPLLNAEQVLTLSARRSSGELMNLMTQRFGNSLDDFEQFATRANGLQPTLADQVLDALRTRGTAVTPRSLLKLAESGIGLSDDVLGGLQRLLGGADAGRVDAVLEAVANDQLAPFLTGAHTAPQPELEAMRRVIATYEAPQVAWAVRLPITDAEALLRDLTPAARTAITDITAAEARDLIGAVGINRVNRALAGGTGGPLRGAHLRTLEQRLPLRVVQDILENGNPVRIARVAANYDAAVARLPGSPVRAGTLTLDSNARSAVDDLVRGFNKHGQPVRAFADLDPNYQVAINAIRRARGLPNYVDPPGGARPTVDDVVGPGADLRTAPVAGAEALAGEAISGQPSRILPQLRGITPNRLDPDYAGVVNDMAGGNAIGGPGGAMDRAVIADTMFAQAAPGQTPALVTVDAGIATRLARRYVVTPRGFTLAGPQDAWTQLVARFPEGRFTIEILGHRLDIVFHAPTGLPPVPP